MGEGCYNKTNSPSFVLLETNMQNSQRSFPLPLLFVGAGLIVLGIAAYVLLSGPGLAPKASAALPTPTFLANYPESQFPRVPLKDALAAYHAKSAVFVDVRGKDAYDIQHIPGALSIPLSDLARRLSELSKTAWIITYCT